MQSTTLLFVIAASSILAQPIVKDGSEEDELPEICGAYSVSGDRVVNGEEAELDEFPWMAILIYNQNDSLFTVCGGSLINSRYVLTAAHCINGAYGEPFRVRLGEHDIRTDLDCVEQGFSEVCNDPVKDVLVEKCIAHPNHNAKRKYANDVALIRLAETIEFTDYISPVCLLQQNSSDNILDIGQELTVAGWGKTEHEIISPVKRKARVPLVNRTECKNEVLEITELCVGGTEKDSCNGDSGGPLMVEDSNVWYLAGIVSHGPKNCGAAGLPATYVNVTSYIDWIKETMKKN